MVADFIELQLRAGGQRADLIQDADLGFAADTQIHGAGDRTGGDNAIVGCRDIHGTGLLAGGQGDIRHIDGTGAGQAQAGCLFCVDVALDDSAVLLGEGADLLAVSALGIVEIDLCALGQTAHGLIAAVADDGADLSRYGADVRQLLGGSIRGAQALLVTAAEDRNGAHFTGNGLHPLVLRGADAAPVALDLVDIQGLALGYGAHHGAGIGVAGADVQAAVCGDGHDLLQTGIGSVDRHSAGIDFHAVNCNIVVAAGRGLAIYILERRHLVAAAVLHIGKLKGHTLGQVHDHSIAALAVVDRCQVLGDAALLGIGRQLCGMHGLRLAANLAVMPGGAVGGLRSILYDLPLAIGVGQGLAVIAILLIATAGDIAGIHGIAIALAGSGVDLCYQVCTGGIVVMLARAGGKGKAFLAGGAGVLNVTVAEDLLLVVVTQHLLVAAIENLAALLAAVLRIARSGAGGCHSLHSLDRIVGRSCGVIAHGIDFRDRIGRNAILCRSSHRHGHDQRGSQQARQSAGECLLHDLFPPIHCFHFSIIHYPLLF